MKTTQTIRFSAAPYRGRAGKLYLVDEANTEAYEGKMQGDEYVFEVVPLTRLHSVFVPKGEKYKIIEDLLAKKKKTPVKSEDMIDIRPASESVEKPAEKQDVEETAKEK